MTDEISNDEVIDRLRVEFARSKGRRLGEMAVERDWVTRQQVEEALCKQREALENGDDGPIGGILMRMGSLSHDRLMDLLEEQGMNMIGGVSLEPNPPASVSTLDQYDLVEVIGQGGMGKIWKAWDRELQRWVAVKTLDAESKNAQDRFIREARLAGRLNHPGIVSIYGAGEAKGISYIAMQLVELDREPSISYRRASAIVRDASHAVQHAHDNGIIHRDLKPGNILIDKNGRVLVADFGLARQREAPPGTTFHGTILGTPAYMAPEQASGAIHSITSASDVFLLGATLYDYLTGRPPFEGEAIGNVLARAIECDPVPLRSANPKLHRDLEIIVMTAMERDPERRYTSAASLADDLSRFLSGEAISASPPSAWDGFARRVRRNPLAWGLGAIVVVALGLLVVLIWLESVEDRVQDLVLRAERSYAAGDHATTRSLSRQAIHLSPGNPEAVYWLTRLRMRRYQIMRGVPEARIVEGLVELVPANPENEEAKQLRLEIEAKLKASVARAMDRGMIALWSDKLDEAIQEFKTISRDAAGFRESRAYSAVAHYLQGRFAEAERILVKHQTIDRELILPILGRTLLARARELQQIGKTTLAEKRFLRAQAAAVEADDAVLESQVLVAWGLMEESIGKDPKDRLKKAIALVGAKRSPEALVGRGDALYSLAAYLRRTGMFQLDHHPEYDQAIAAYSDAVTLDPVFGAAYLRRAQARRDLAVTLQSAGMKIGAMAKSVETDFESALRCNPRYRSASIGLAQIRGFIGRIGAKDTEMKRSAYRKEIADLEEVIQKYPRHAASKKALAVSLMSMAAFLNGRGEDPFKSLNRAIGLVSRAVEMNEWDAFARIHRASILKARADYLALRGRESDGDYEAAIDELYEAVRINPTSAATLSMRAQFRSAWASLKLQRGDDVEEDFRAAFEDYQSALTLNPTHGITYRNRGVTRIDRALLWRADADKAINEWRAAIRDLTRAIEINRNDWNSILNRGTAHVSLGSMQRRMGRDPSVELLAAISDLNASISIKRTDAMAWVTRGLARISLGSFKASQSEDGRPDVLKAVADLDRAVLLNPEDSGAYQARADAHRWLGLLEGNQGRNPTGHFQSAIQDLDQSLTLNPKNIEARNSAVLTHKAMAGHLLAQKRNPSAHFKAAIGYLDAIVLTSPRVPEWYRVRGAVHLESSYRMRKWEDPEEGYRNAIRDFSKALRLNPQDAQAWMSRGECRVTLARSLAGKKDKYEQLRQGAISDLEQAVKLNPAFQETANPMIKAARALKE